MIRKVKREDIPECVKIIKNSFMTVAEEFGFTVENAPRFTAFATTEDRLFWQIYVLIPKGIDVTNWAKLLGHSVEVNLKNYSFADYDYCEIAQKALDDDEGTPWGPPIVFSFETKKLRKSL